MKTTIELALHFVFVLGSLSLSSFGYAATSSGSPARRGNSSFFPTYQSEKMEVEQTLARELERTLDSLPYVDEVHVHVSIAASGIWKESGEQSGASVVIISPQPDRIQSTEIQALVAGASASLQNEDVRVFVYQQPEVASRVDSARVRARALSFLPWGERWKLLCIAFILAVLVGASGVLLVGIRRRILRRKRQRQHMGSIGSV